MTETFDLDAYLERIRFRGNVHLDIDSLQRLHLGHCFHIPFENLDIHLNRPIRLQPEYLFHKQVHEKRGGYCFEMNGMFAFVLEWIGFKVKRLLARVMHHQELEPRNHQLMLVELEGRDWVVDVGFGGQGIIAPIPLEVAQPEKQFAETVQLVLHEELGWVLQSLQENGWEDQYGFTLEPFLPIDYTTMNFYYSNSPDSLFTQNRIINLPTRDGRIRLRNNKLKIIANKKIAEEIAPSDEQYRILLKKHFGIVINESFVKAMPEENCSD